MQNIDNQATRDISYAYAAQSRAGKVLIRTLENATGRLSLIKRADGYQNDVAQGASFWDVMMNRYGLSLEIGAGSLQSFPKAGPLVVVANHPFGILDGLMLGQILSTVRNGEFRILAHSVFQKSTDIDRIILPIAFDETRAAVAQNLQTRKTALEYLRKGGAIGVFPGGTVSTARNPFSKPFDPGWRSFTAKMIAKSNATVVPIYFHGANSRLFQIASHLHSNLRVALLINEFRRRTDTAVKVVIGSPIAPEKIAGHNTDPIAMMDFLRAETYALSPEVSETPDFGYEFEDIHKRDQNDGGRDTR